MNQDPLICTHRQISVNLHCFSDWCSSFGAFPPIVSPAPLLSGVDEEHWQKSWPMAEPFLATLAGALARGYLTSKHPWKSHQHQLDDRNLLSSNNRSKSRTKSSTPSPGLCLLPDLTFLCSPQFLSQSLSAPLLTSDSPFLVVS